MGEARGRSEWNQTSLLCAMIVNSNPFRSGGPISPDKFNPYKTQEVRKPDIEISIGDFARMKAGVPFDVDKA